MKSIDVYDNPKYYEIAFSFRDIRREVDLFEECFRRYSRIPVRRVLDLGCGPSPHLEELARRGYEYVGLDINGAMLAYAQRKAKTLGIKATLIQADMRSFALEKPVDFAFTLLGSLYAETTAELLSHFSAVADALNPGGLYLLDGCINFRWDDPSGEDERWTIEKEGVRVAVRFAREEVIDRAAQICKYRLLMDVNDHGKELHLETHEVTRTIFPQEFLLLVEKSGRFGFVGWWNNWDLDKPLDGTERINRPIAVIRRL